MKFIGRKATPLSGINQQKVKKATENNTFNSSTKKGKRNYKSLEARSNTLRKFYPLAHLKNKTVKNFN